MSRLEELLKQQTPVVPSATPQKQGSRLSELLRTPTTQPTTQSETLSKAQEILQKQGLEEKFEKIKPEPGETPNKFLSGGFIMDTFDWLNALSYGTVGVLKGKGFVEGIKTRQSFSDKDALGGKGVLGVVGGIGLDILTDPLTYIAPISVLSKFGKTTKITPAVKKAQSAFAKTMMGKKLGSALIYRFGQDPLYKEMAERTIKNSAVQIDNITNIAQPLIKEDKAVRELFLTTNEKGQTIRKSLDEVTELLKSKKVSEGAVKSYKELGNIIDGLTKEMVDLKLLPEDVYQNINKYVNNQYLNYAQKDAKKFITGARQALDNSLRKARKDIPEEVREQLGQIFDAGYLLPETAMKMARTVENAKFLNMVNKSFALNDAADGFAQIPKSANWGKLSGKYVPEFIQKDLVEYLAPTRTSFEKATKPFVSAFKYGKVILNPATHIRNMMSNFVLNSFEGMNPLDPKAINAYVKAAKELKRKGPLYQEARQFGLDINTFASAEIKDLLQTTGKFKGKLKDTAKKIADIYEKEEQWAKLSQYIFQRGKGITPNEAWKIAERATFNYAQVTPFIRRLRESILGYPFLTFTYKVTPQVGRTLLKKPTRISNIGKIKEGLEELVPEEEREQVRATQPKWVKDGFYLQLPNKDKEGRSLMLDLTYMLPFGDLASGQVFNRGINSATGLYESPVQTATQKLPFINTLVELNQNQDFYGNKIYKESDPVDKQISDIGRHVIKFMSPPLLNNFLEGGYRPDGEKSKSVLRRSYEKQIDADGGGKQTRNLYQEALRNIGLKINPVDLQTQEYWSEYMKEKAIETFLKEEGVAKGFEVLYESKQSDTTQ